MDPSIHEPDPLQGHPREWPSTPYSDDARAPVPRPESSCRIALLGDCTVSCDYFPPANRPENHLAVRLRRAFPDQPILIRNIAKSGETAARFIRSGRIGEALGPGFDPEVVFIRYGINDRKEDGILGCIAHLELVCREVRRRSQNCRIIIESGIWVDYPAHYLWDRNAKLRPLYTAMRGFAQAQDCHFLDIFGSMEAEALAGNWDLRVRGLPDAEHTIVDDSLDRFYGNDPAFFTNIHPNSRCLGLIADWEVEAIRELVGDRLPGFACRNAHPCSRSSPSRRGPETGRTRSTPTPHQE